MRIAISVTVVAVIFGLASCGTVKEKTAPCKRPAELTPFADDPRHDCGAMRPVNDPAAAFGAIGLN